MYLVLVAGGHASGKRTVANELVELLKKEADGVCDLQIKIVNLVDYAGAGGAPQHVDFAKLLNDVQNFRSSLATGIDKKQVCVVYGNYALYNEELCSLASLRLFLDTDADERLSRWIMRDAVQSKKLQLSEVLQEYLDKCRTEYSEYIDGTKARADMLLPQGSDPLTAEVLASGILSELATGDVMSVSSRRRPVVNLRDDTDGMFYSTD